MIKKISQGSGVRGKETADGGQVGEFGRMKVSSGKRDGGSVRGGVEVALKGLGEREVTEGQDDSEGGVGLVLGERYCRH